jgi:hypothetical protein
MCLSSATIVNRRVQEILQLNVAAISELQKPFDARFEVPPFAVRKSTVMATKKSAATMVLA